MDEHCPEKQVWFAFGDGSVPPQVLAYTPVNGRRSAPPSLTVTLVKDKNYAKLTRCLELSAKGAACADALMLTVTPRESLPDCTTYRVMATFMSRVDGVSKELHAPHMRSPGSANPDGKGFRHMGLFDVQNFVQNIENVVAVDEADLRNLSAKPE